MAVVYFVNRKSVILTDPSVFHTLVGEGKEIKRTCLFKTFTIIIICY